MDQRGALRAAVAIGKVLHGGRHFRTSHDPQLRSKRPRVVAAVLAGAFVLATVAGPVSLSADEQASSPAADPAAIVGEWFHRASGGSIFTWAFADPDTGEATVEWSVSHSAVPGPPTLLGRGHYRLEGADRLILVFVSGDGQPGTPQSHRWRRCGHTLTIWRNEEPRSYVNERDAVAEPCN